MGVLLACMVAAAVIPFVSVAPDHEVSEDTATMAHGLGLLDDDAHYDNQQDSEKPEQQLQDPTSGSSRGYLPELIARMGQEDAEEREAVMDEELEAAAEEHVGETGGAMDNALEESTADDYVVDADAPAPASEEEAPADIEDGPAKEGEAAELGQQEIEEEEVVELTPLLTSPWVDEDAEDAEDAAAGMGEAPAAWPTRLVVVPAVYNEWDHPADEPMNASLPDWARPSVEAGDHYSMVRFYRNTTATATFIFSLSVFKQQHTVLRLWVMTDLTPWVRFTSVALRSRPTLCPTTRTKLVYT